MPENTYLESFFTDLRDTYVSGVGVEETSCYPYLSNLLNLFGKKLKTMVRCIIHPPSIGAGLPDGALITADQKSKAGDPLADGLIPSRGVMEIKAPDEDLQAAAGSEQIAKYLNKYGRVVLTNLGRDIAKDEAREFTHIARRIAALLLLEPELDKNYSTIKANCHPWGAASASTKEDV